jgi:hypothetical protein
MKIYNGKPNFIDIFSFICFILLWPFFCQLANGQDLEPEILEVKKIWSQAPHNAFTDLVRWRGKFYCAFREGKGHAGDVGKLRIICSADGVMWKSTVLLELPDYDLRDAALSVTPDDRLMVLGGAQQTSDDRRATGTFVSFSSDATNFTDPKIVIPKGRWLWRVTWQDDIAYGVAYGAPDRPSSSTLLKTTDGISYEVVTDKLLAVGGWPTEARVRFEKDGTGYCLHRRDGQGNTAYFGISKPPYVDWEWHDMGIRFGGPNFLRLPGGHWVGAGRLYDRMQRTEIVAIDPHEGKMKPLLRLPSGGDTSYPGMVWHDDVLWVSYYASHQGQTAIYLAKIRFPSLISPIDIANQLEPFVDKHLIERMNGVEQRLHHPRPEESVIRFDKPWEGAFCGYATVLNDGQKFRLYYRGLPQAGGDGTDLEVTCCAESDDGIQWTKPNLGIFQFEGSTDNNIVLKGETPASHNFSPFVDTNPATPPSERFKALGGTSKGLIGFRSADGKHWKRVQKDPVFTKGIFDSQNVSFYSVAEKKYVCYFRTWTGEGYRGFRTVSRTTSTDFIHWSDPVAMSFGETPNEHLYTNQTSPYFRAPHIALGIAARFMPGRRVLTGQEAQRIEVNPKYFGDISDAVLLSTRGGNQYDRSFMESFVRPGMGLENWVSRTNYPALGIVQTGRDELSFYIQKNYGQPSSYLRRYSMRLDGFASVHAGYRPGTMTTKLIRFSSRQADVKGNKIAVELNLNAATSAAGSIRVELTGRRGNPIAGFSFDDCDEIIGDKTDHVVSWKGKTDLEKLANQPIRIRFQLKDADLFALQFK